MLRGLCQVLLSLALYRLQVIVIILELLGLFCANHEHFLNLILALNYLGLLLV